MSFTQHEIGLMQRFCEETKDVSHDMPLISQQDVVLPFTDSKEHDEQQARDLFTLIESAANVKLTDLRASNDFNKGAPPHRNEQQQDYFDDGEFGFAVSMDRTTIETLLELRVSKGKLDKNTTLQDFSEDNPRYTNTLQIWMNKEDLETVKNKFEQQIQADSTSPS